MERIPYLGRDHGVMTRRQPAGTGSSARTHTHARTCSRFCLGDHGGISPRGCCEGYARYHCTFLCLSKALSMGLAHSVHCGSCYMTAVPDGGNLPPKSTVTPPTNWVIKHGRRPSSIPCKVAENYEQDISVKQK